jgi:hypothetical protein
MAEDFDALLAQLAILREEHADAVRYSRGASQDGVHEKGRILYGLVQQIEAIEPGASMSYNIQRRALGLPPIHNLLEMAETIVVHKPASNFPIREVPPELEDIRRRTLASVGWVSSKSVKQRGAKEATLVLRRISEAEHDALPPAQKTKCRWRADPELTKQLVAAERAYTLTFAQVNTTGNLA